MVAGDTCLIRAGTYRETVVVPKSGTSTAPITFKAYGSEVVTINGANPINGWSSAGGNIYTASAPSLHLNNGCTQVFQNGAMKPEARWPNAGPGYPWQDSSINPSPDWAYCDAAGYDSNNAHGWIQDAALPSRSSGYWTGAKLHIMAGYAWLMNQSSVTAYNSSSKTLTTDDNSGGDKTYMFTAGNEYYLTGKKGELDSQGEWFYEPANGTLSFYSTNGAPTGIEARKRAYGFDLSGRSYINLTKLRFFACTINSSDTSSHCTFDGLTMKYLAHSENTPDYFGLYLQDHFVLKNSELAYDSRGMIVLSGSDIKIINNHIHDGGYIPEKRALIWSSGLGYRNLISHNTMHEAGLAVMHSPGKSSIVEYNEMYNAGRLCKDTGIIYVGNLDFENTVFRYNILHGAPGGKGQKGAPNHGLYLDNYNANCIIHHNIIYDVPNMGIMLNRRHNYHIVFNNTLYGDNGGITAGYFVGTKHQDGETGIKIFNNILKGNPQKDWHDADVRFNFVNDPKFVDYANADFRLQSTSQARDNGIIIPGVTEGYAGNAPDAGALEYGGSDWTQNVGCSATPLSSEPSYKFPDMIFANRVKNAGFETGALSPNWSSTGPVTIQSTLWMDDHVHNGYKSVKLGAGSSEVKQTVTGLLPNRGYRLYAAIQNVSSSNTVKLGVRNFGRTTKEMTSPLASAADRFIVSDLYFVTGPTNTTAEIYVSANVATSGTPVYFDNVSVEMSDDMDPQPSRMPFLHYNFNEGSGSVANDTTTNGKDAALSGSPSWVTGVQGSALKFNGTSSYGTIPSTTTPGEITIALWAKSGASTWNSSHSFISQRPAFSAGGKGAGSTGIQFMVNTTSGTHYHSYSPTNGFDIAQWHHYAFTYSPTSKVKAIYVDGVMKETILIDGATAVAAVNAPIIIGKDNKSSNYLNGQLDDIRVYDRALPAEEIRALFNLDKTLALRLKFDEPVGAKQAWDSSGFGRNGTLNSIDATLGWVKGRIGGALSLNGLASYVSTPSFPSPAAVTVACFAKSSLSTWTGNDCLVSKDPSFVLSSVKGSKNVKFTVKIGGVAKTATFNAPSSFDITAWHQYLGTYSTTSGAVRLYIDGVLQNSITGVSGNIDGNTGPVYIGRDASGSNFLGGQVDDVQIYGRELNASEVLDLSIRTYGPYDPITVTTTTANVPPTANAGSDKSITLPTNSITLTGSGNDADGSITSYAWSQVNGPSTASFSSTTAASTTVSELVQGSYTFRLTVKDNAAASASDDVVVVVTPAANVAPTANAGADKTITLPTSSVSLTGSGTDTDGSIASYAWTQVSGPSTATISGASSATTTMSALVQGSYTFRLTVKDNAGASASDDVIVTVNPAANITPTANAGADMTITLPTSSVSITGSGTDSDGTITSYAWTQISGPSTASISAPTAASTTIGSLVQGSYSFRLTVKDNAGASGSDDVLVTVNPAANVPPTANAGSDKSITLPVDSVSLTGSGTDSDGTIASYAWSQVSGPSKATISAASSASTTMSALVQGSYTFRLTVKDSSGASANDDVVVTVSAGQSVVSFTLVNADTDTDIGTLKNGDTLNLATLPTRMLNIRANTNPSVVGSVGFTLSGAETKTKTENAAPYALAANNATDYSGWTPVVGTDTLTATPYSGSSLGGVAGTALSITLKVIDQLPPAITSSLTATGIQNKAFKYQITANNTPQSFNATGLPAGLSIDKTTGIISGTPTVSGSFTVTIAATNVAGTDTKSLALTVNKPQVLFVVGNATLNSGDSAVKTHLESLGFVVTIKAATSSTTADASGKNLVIISSTALSTDSNTKYRDIAVPVLTWEAYLFDDMGMTGATKGTNYDKKASQTTISIVNSSHPMAAGLSGTQTVYGSAGYLELGQPTSAAVNIATVTGDSTKSVIFGYDKGAQMIGLTAPAKRVGFFLYDTEASVMTSQGWTLFDSAVKWALN